MSLEQPVKGEIFSRAMLGLPISEKSSQIQALRAKVWFVTSLHNVLIHTPFDLTPETQNLLGKASIQWHDIE
ncbi:MAG TPA: hypothetical protein V6C84_22605 [Coleofasciculaceae cyanobacterium]|jgi:hypothetical protein